VINAPRKMFEKHKQYQSMSPVSSIVTKKIIKAYVGLPNPKNRRKNTEVLIENICS
jgi:hypothetical protein